MRSFTLPCYAFALTALLACSDDGMDMGVDSVPACDCPELTAMNVTYDSASSDLAAGNAQDALDELAARPAAPTDAWERITFEEVTMTSPTAGTSFQLQLVCPNDGDGTPGKMLGGACHVTSGATTVMQTSMSLVSYSCIWSKPEGMALEFKVQGNCLARN